MQHTTHTHTKTWIMRCHVSLTPWDLHSCLIHSCHLPNPSLVHQLFRVIHSFSSFNAHAYTHTYSQCQDGGQVIVMRDEASIENNYSWELDAPWPLQYEQLLLVSLAHVYPTSCPVCFGWWEWLLWMMKILFIIAVNLTAGLALAALLQWLTLLRWSLFILFICLSV